MQKLFVKANVIPKTVPVDTLIAASVHADAAKAGVEVASAIPGLPEGPGSESSGHEGHVLGSGFRVRGLKAAPRNDGYVSSTVSGLYE